jgi:hypothetical protein
MHSFSNVDWVGDKYTRRSTLRYIFHLRVVSYHRQITNKLMLHYPTQRMNT